MANPEPHPPDGDAAKRHRIRVVNATQRVTDILSLSENELSTLLQDLASSMQHAGGKEADALFGEGDRLSKLRAFFAFESLAKTIRRSTFEKAAPDAVPIIALRQLLYDRGVDPFGVNATARSNGRSNGRSAGRSIEEQASAPHRKELWFDKPPRDAAGLSFATWAVGVAADDRIDLSALVVLPTRLGRDTTPQYRRPIEFWYALEALRAGGWGSQTLITAGQLLATRSVAPRSGVIRAEVPPSAREALAWVLEQTRAFLVGGAPGSPTLAEAASVYPELATNRLAPSSYTFRTVSVPREDTSARSAHYEAASYVLELPAEDGLNALGRTLNVLYQFASSTAGEVLAHAAFSPSAETAVVASVGAAPTTAAPLARLVKSEAGQSHRAKPHASIFPLLADRKAPSREARDNARQAEGAYATALEWLVEEIEKSLDLVVAHRPSTPLNLVSEVLSYRAMLTLRDLLVQARPGASEPGSRRKIAQRFLTSLQQERQARNLLQQIHQTEQDQVVRARQYLIIAEQKLGTARFEAIMGILLSDPTRYDVDSPGDVLAAIDASRPVGTPVPTTKKTADGAGPASADRKLVVTEYANRIEEWKLQAGNTCPHVALMQRFRAAVSLDEERKIMKRLREFFNRAAGAARSRGRPQLTGDEMAWVVCRNCSFRLICPHLLELYQQKQDQAPYENIRRALQPYVSTVNYTGAAAVFGYAFYCKICSEELFVRAEESGLEELGGVGNMDNDFKKFLWAEMMKIVAPRPGAPVLIRFTQSVDPRRFSGEAADACHPLALVAAGARRAARGATTGQRLARTDQNQVWQELLGVIYLYAYLFNLVLADATGEPAATASRSKPELSQHDVGISLENVRPNAAPEAYANALLTHLVKTHAVLLSKLENVTNEQVGNQFRDAYRHILDTHGRLQVVAQNGAKVFLTNLTKLDPYFAALNVGARVKSLPGAPPGGPKPLGVVPADEPAKAAQEFRTIMGATLADLVGAKFDKAFMPFIRAALSRRGSVEYPTGVPPEWAYHIPELGLYKRAWGNRRAVEYWQKHSPPPSGAPDKGPQKLAALVWVGGRREPERRPRKTRSAKAPPAKDDARPAPDKQSEGARLFADSLFLAILYTTGVHNDETWDRYLQVAATAFRREKEFRRGFVYGQIPAYNFAYLSSPAPRFLSPRDVRITRLYDENGEAHVWDVYLWHAPPSDDEKKGEVYTFTKAEITKALNAADREGRPSPLADYFFDDWICSVCGARWKQTDKLDAKKAQRQLQVKARLSTFYIYYESRCPEDGLHVFGGASACSKCGVDSTLLVASGRKKAPKEALAYYEKYADRLERVRKAASSEAVRSMSKVTSAPTAAKTSKAAKPPARSFDSVLKLATFMQKASASSNITVAQIEAMGATEGRTIDDVKGGVGAPPPPERLDDPRILAADNTVRLLLTQYCTLYNALRYNGGNPPTPADQWITTLLRRSAAGRNTTADLAGLPTPLSLGLDDGYFRIYQEAVAAARQADDQALWAQSLLHLSIDTFCQVGLKIANQGGALGKAFVLHAAGGSLRGESLFTVAGKFKWKAAFGDGEGDMVSMSADDATNDDVRRYGDVGTGTEDVLAQQMRDFRDGVEGSEDRFSNEAVDVDDDVAAAND